MNSVPASQRPSIAMDRADFEFVRTLLRNHAAVMLDDSKGYLVSSRLVPLARREGFESVAELVSHLRSRPFGRLHNAAMEALVTTETSFFRDLPVFEALRTDILPELIRNRRHKTMSLSLWSAGCSSGQEPYSLAMMVRQHFPFLEGWNLQILASDISSEMINRAQAGVYHQHEINRGLPATLLVRYFTQDGTGWKLADDIRRMVSFFQHNVTHDWLTVVPRVDLLFLRNILIYFDVDTRRRVLRRVRMALKPDGYLVLGTAETTLNLDDAFRRVQIGRSVFYQLDRGGVA